MKTSRTRVRNESWLAADSRVLFFVVGFVAWALCSPVRADTFTGVRYDPRADELVVTMQYPGTNPNHGFTIQWDSCPSLARGQSTYDIAAEVLDSQWNDDARQTFTKTVHFSL